MIVSFLSFLSLSMRREGDSNPRYALGVYTLSRRASSTTRASLPLCVSACKSYRFSWPFSSLAEFSATNVFFFIRFTPLSFHINFPKRSKLIHFKTFIIFLRLFYPFSNTFRALFVVMSAISSVSFPYMEARWANVYWMNAVSFLLPLWGTGAK